jgi:hypothetical protein
MSVFGGNPLLLTSAAGGGIPSEISRSLRFNSGDSAYLNRTPASAGNRKTWTWAGWVKRSGLGTEQVVWTAGASTSSGEWSAFRFITTDQLQFINNTSNSTDINLLTTQVFRDASAWYHILLRADISNATANDRIDIYINGIKVDAYSTQTQPATTVDTGINGAQIHNIGREAARSDYYCNLYLADVHFIDGQALTPASFTTTDSTTGQLIPTVYSSSYGTNGFYLDFSSNATTAALGTDTSGNSNTWTVNNFSVTAGSGNDSLVDTPTSYGTDTGVGNEVRGNYATFNALKSGTPGAYTPTLTNGNLDIVSSSGWKNGASNISVDSGKWYCEVTIGSTAIHYIGICSNSFNLTDGNHAGNGPNTVGYYYDGQLNINGSLSGYGAAYTTGDVMGIALNLDTGQLTFYKNGTSQGVATTGLSGYYIFLVSINTSTTPTSINFGQRAFAYTAPSGFKALVDTNLPTPVIAESNTVMDVVTYTGNGAARSITGLAFSPDWVWIKSRSAATGHKLIDSVRGATFAIAPGGSLSTDTNGLTAFTSDGFLLGTDTNYNNTSATYVGWCWDTGGTTTTETSPGTVSVDRRVNVSAGFSVTKFTSPASGNFSIAHGLGIAPSFAIVNAVTTYHASVCTTTSNYINLDSTSGLLTFATIWGAALPTSSVVSMTVGGAVGANAACVAYCFAPVSGYSSFGSYTGNGSNDGPFIYTGFRPKWVMIKSSSIGGPGYDWCVRDSSRNLYNVTDDVLSPNTSGTGFTAGVDFLSNGFRLRTSGATENASSQIYVWAAFAESPFQYARAR